MRILFFPIILLTACHASPPIETDAWVVENSCESTWAKKKAPRWTWGEYKEILAELGKPHYVIVPMGMFQQAVSQHSEKVVVGLRHDLDGNICNARTMARLEQEAGIKATYFLNHNDLYYSWRDEHGVRRRRESSVARYREIQNWGHEIGLHYDMLTSFFEHGEDPAALLSEELAWLKARGFDVMGGAAHGSKTARLAGFVNYELFKGMTSREGFELTYGGRSYTLGRLDYATFVTYETYHLGTNSMYYSEAGGKWNTHPLSSVSGLPSLGPGQSAQILIHPVWWGDKEPES